MRILVLDLGGVLVNLDAASLRPVLRGDPASPAWSEWLLRAEIARRFDTGRCTPAEFFAAAAAEVGKAGVTPEEFGQAFTGWVVGWYPGAEALLRRLRARGPVACLSNSNAAHWPRLRAMGLPGCFDAALLSWQLGIAKPDPDLWPLVERRLGARGAEILFVDDSPTNVAAAARHGWDTLWVPGFDALEQALGPG